MDPEDHDQFLSWLRELDHTEAFDQLGDVAITTLFTGIDQGGWLTGSAPILWETIVSNSDELKVVRRYTSQPDALSGHAAALAAVVAARGRAIPPGPSADRPPGPGHRSS